LSAGFLYLLRYDEIGLKGGNRKLFEERLASHVRESVKGCGKLKVRRIQGRIIIDGDFERVEELEERLGKIPGLHSFSRGYHCELELEALKIAACEALRRSWDGKTPVTFRISTRRSNKKFPLRAVEVNVEVGAHLVRTFGQDLLKVKLENAEVDISLELQKQGAVVYEGLKKCIGGLPVGSAGRVLCLLSGGIDSPVAAFQMMRRGCWVDYIFFENRVFLGRAAYDKVVRLAKVLGSFQSRARLFVVPFSNIQVAIRDACTDRHRVVLYRRFMYRIADRVAKDHKLLGLVNGECLGQVASQTLENIQAVNQVVESCVYRPLISMDKVQIMQTSRAIGTFDISIEDAPDCCSVFMPAKPATRTKISWLKEDESKLDVEKLVSEAIENMELLNVEGYSVS
jgi:tRNA uracil 4-sulfurtransferase